MRYRISPHWETEPGNVDGQTVAHSVTGPAVLISFLIAGVASAAAALCYAEFAGMIPKAGSAYTYGYVALGEIVGWFIGWDLLLEYIAVAAVVAIGVSGYFRFLLEQVGISLPDWMMGALGTGDGHVFDVFAALFCLGTAWVLSRGIRSVGRFETIAVAIKVSHWSSSSSRWASSTSTAPTTPPTSRSAPPPSSPARPPCSSRCSDTTR